MENPSVPTNAKDMDTTNHIKHPDVVCTGPLISEIMNQLSLINPSKNESKKIEVNQSVRWKKFKFTSFEGTKK